MLCVCMCIGYIYFLVCRYLYLYIHMPLTIHPRYSGACEFMSIMGLFYSTLYGAVQSESWNMEHGTALFNLDVLTCSHGLKSWLRKRLVWEPEPLPPMTDKKAKEEGTS